MPEEGGLNKFDSTWLDSLEENWQKNAGKADSFDKPDGKYVGVLSLVQGPVEFSNGKPGIKWSYVIEEGELAGEQHMDFDNLSSEKDIQKLGQKLRKFGYDPTEVRPRDLPRVFGELTERKPRVAFTLKTREGTGEYAGRKFQNMYIDKIFGPSDVVEDGGAAYLEPKPGMWLAYNNGAGRQVGQVKRVTDLSIIFQGEGDTETEIPFENIIDEVPAPEASADTPAAA